MIEVVVTDEFLSWYETLKNKDTIAVTKAVDRLEILGIQLPFPYSSAIEQSKLPLRELRVQSGGKPLRIIYAFDPKRSAVLIIGGDKTGGDKRFYEKIINKAEKIWIQYLKEL